MIETLKKRRHFLRGLLIVVVGLVACVLLMPVVLSSGWARARALVAVNERIEGTVAIADWRLSWFGSMNASDIRYSDPAGHDVMVRSVRVPRGLLALARTRDLGTVLVQGLCVRIVPPPPAEKPKSKTSRPSETSPSADTEPKPGTSFSGIPLKGILKMQDAKVEVVDGESSRTLLQDMDVTVDFSEVPGPVTWTLSTGSGVSSGNLGGSGSVEFVPDAVLDPLTLPMHAELCLTALQQKKGLHSKARFPGIFIHQSNYQKHDQN
jgi:hypothetical protein